MSIDAAFYKNVCLLTQVATPSSEFQKYFRKGMFDKPNTMGFIHVSQYLLLLYNSQRFKNMITWPLYSKRDEGQYRIEVKDYLAILSYENPDINFPAISLSHLIIPSGAKVVNLLWKLSRLTLRSYIWRECHISLLSAPNAGMTSKLTEIYLNGLNAKQARTIVDLHEKWNKGTALFENFANEKLNEIRARKCVIFETKQCLERYIDIAPVSDSVSVRLMDIEDTEIINTWEVSIYKDSNSLHNWNIMLQGLQTISNTVCDIIQCILVHSRIFNFRELPNILPNRGNVSVDYVQESECIVNRLYTKDLLNLRVMFLLLHQILDADIYYLNIYEPANYRWCKEQLKNLNEHMKVLNIEFQNLLMQTDVILSNVHHDLRAESSDAISDMVSLCVLNKEILWHSPKIMFSVDCCEEKKRLLRRLWPSPMKGTHKMLFKRHASKAFKSPKCSLSKLCTDDNDWDNISGWTSPCALSPIHKRTFSNAIDVSPKYSRLFNFSNSRSNYFLESTTSSPKRIRLDLTPTGVSPQRVRGKVRLNTDGERLFTPSCKLTNAPASPCDSSKNIGKRILGNDDMLPTVKSETIGGCVEDAQRTAIRTCFSLKRQMFE